MKPIAFDGCMGWLHEGHAEHAVIICESLGHEAIWTHKLTRALAEQLAGKGITTLRFNYPGSGDSAGDELDAGRFDACVASVRRAIELLRARDGIRSLTLVGIRAGVLFATLAAAEAGVDGGSRIDAIVALAPVVRGRAYLRELSVVHRQWVDTAPPAIRDAQREEPCLNVLGHRFPADFVDALKAIDLCNVVRDAAFVPDRMLLIEPAQGDGPALRAALHSRGVTVAFQAFSDWPTTMLDCTRSRLPRAAIEAMVRWIGEQVSALPAPPAAPAPWDDRAAPTLALNGMTERIVAVGRDRLVGVLCAPAVAAAPQSDGPVVLIVNTSANPRNGEGQFGVRLARAMARVGITTLRFDIDGVGDSGPCAPDDQSGVLYSDRAIDDVAAAADWLQSQGYRNVISAGICSGAYAALHAATRSTALTGVIAINLARFIWPTGVTLAEVQKQRNNSVRGYLVSGRDWRRWKRLFTERRDLRPIVRALASQCFARLRVPAMEIAARLGWTPPLDTPRGLMRHLAQRNVWTLLVYGALDPGIDDVGRHFGAVGRAFRRSRHVRLHTIAHLDHALFGTAGSESVIELCIGAVGGDAGDARRRIAGGPLSDGARRAFDNVSVHGS
ncbi:alpha/beta hydrolase [Burkholderia pseudomultivorans]|uniref:alpha/beta hydrolase n=1 Tax=Burkholderia pseudomultivorans TaxID=1207504 RepID=UPI000842016D|nr:alpha/beta hydrolase [Burkholderia pseudomultivorans]